MNQTNEITQTVRDVAKQINNRDGQEKFLRALEKVSACVEISPPLTLEKLMQIYGTEVIYYTPEDLAGKVLRVGRISTVEERENWLNSLKKLDKVLETPENVETALNYGLLTAEAVLAYSFSFLIDEFDSLSVNSKIAKFTDELAMGVKRLQDILQIKDDYSSKSNEDFDFLRNLRHGEKFAHQLEWLTQIVDISSNKQTHKPEIHTTKNSVKIENQRASSIATESMLKREFLAVSSSASYQAMREVVALKKFNRDVESPYPTAYVEKATIKGKIRLTPLKNETVYGEQLKELEASMWRKIEQLSDLHVDVIDAMCASWITQAANDDSRAVITADDILKLRGLKPHLGGNGRRGGYAAEQRAEIIEAIQDLENVWFEITESVQRGKARKSEFIQSRAIAVLDRGGQMNINGELDVMWFVFRPGTIFARYLLTEGRQTALLSAQALRYNVRTEAVEKRLVRYLSWQWRIRSKTTTYLQPYEVQTLIKECGLTVPTRNANRCAERLEKALSRLQDDDLISSWSYKNWDWSMTKQNGWVNDWLAAKISVEPPAFIKDSYEMIHQSTDSIQQNQLPKPIKIPNNEADLAQLFKTERKARKLTQNQVAERANLSQATVSRVETGKKVSDDEREKICEWLLANTTNIK